MKPMLALAALAACAPQSADPAAPGSSAAAPRQCFFASSVSSYREVDETAVNLRVGVKQVWRLDFEGSCPGVEWSRGRIGLVRRGGGGAICRGFDVDVVVQDEIHPRRCLVRDVRRLTDAEVAALPAAQTP